MQRHRQIGGERIIRSASRQGRNDQCLAAVAIRRRVVEKPRQRLLHVQIQPPRTAARRGATYRNALRFRRRHQRRDLIVRPIDFHVGDRIFLQQFHQTFATAFRRHLVRRLRHRQANRHFLPLRVSRDFHGLTQTVQYFLLVAVEYLQTTQTNGLAKPAIADFLFKCMSDFRTATQPFTETDA